MKILTPFLAAFFLLQPGAYAEETVFQAGPSQNTLIQLFTSDASAASNPALEWMSVQKNKDPQNELWARFVPVAMHVRHWDGSGYRDPFAKNEFEDMLVAYQRSWKATNVYAPTLVVNGVEWSGWGRGQEVPNDRHKQTGVLTVHGALEAGIGKFSAGFQAAETLKKESFTIHACLVVFGLTSRPSDGRNRGRSLQHDFMAAAYRSEDFRHTRTAFGASVEIPLPKVQREGARYGMVFWVTKKNNSTPLQATGGFLPES